MKSFSEESAPTDTMTETNESAQFNSSEKQVTEPQHSGSVSSETPSLTNLLVSNDSFRGSQSCVANDGKIDSESDNDSALGGTSI